MKSQTRRIIEHYEKACMELLREFVGMYWKDTTVEYFVIGVGNITGAACVNDLFIDWQEIEYCVLHQPKEEAFWAWRQYLEMMDYNPQINHKTFFTTYPDLPCTKVNPSTKKKSSITKLSIGNRRRKDGKK